MPSTAHSNPIIDAVLLSIAKSERLLVIAHARPDGDAVGSLLACWMMLQRMGKNADMALSDRVPCIYRSLPCAGQVRQWSHVEGDYDTVILLECDGIPRTRMSGLEKRFLINIDHHTSGRAFADVNWIDSSACAVAELIYHLALAAGIDITPEMATCLYTAMLSDTGSFCYEGTDAHTFELARNLVRHGADPVLIAQNVYFSNPAAKMLLLGAALANLHHEEHLAWLWVTESDMDRTHAVEEDCEGIVNYAIGITGIEVAVFLRELRDHTVRLSLRSKGRVNVATIAERFGGGGHENASGCTLDGPLALATEQILKHLRGELAAAAAAHGVA
jgi:bifunctional oligoribonuclease and PAP phosphatase NrnA